MTIAPGQVIGSYRVVEKIGEGGMGAVYRAEDTAIQRSVVLKLLGTTSAGDPDMLKRFQREVEMIASLEHPHILPVYEYGQVQGEPYIAMRFMRGGSLHDRLQDADASREQLLRIFDQVAEALDFAHDRDVIHRDLKPGNVLLDESGNAYLADFGLAKTMEGSRDLTATGGILGTPAYMSPEQARGEKLDRRSDVYALAVMAFEALSGQFPFTANTPMEFLYKHLTERPRSILTVAADVPLAADEVFTQGLAKEPARRPARATDFMRMLRQALAEAGASPQAAAGRGAPGVRAAAGSAGGAAQAGSGRAPVPATSVPGRRSPAAREAGGAGEVRPARRRLPILPLALAGGAVVLVAAVGIGVLLFRDRLFGPRVHSYPVGQSPRSLVTDGQSVWVANFDDDSVARLAATGCEQSPDPCGVALTSFAVPSLPAALAHDGFRLWVAGALDRRLVQYDPDGTQLAEFALPDVATALLAVEDELWAASEIGRSLTRIRPATGAVDRFPLEIEPLAVLWDGGSLWAASGTGRALVEVDPASGAVRQTLALEGAPSALAFDGQFLWVAFSDRGEVVRLDAADGTVTAQVPVGVGTRALLFNGSTVWAASQQEDQVVGIDPASGAVRTTLGVEGGPYALAWVACGSGCGDLWIAGESGDTVSRVRLP